MRLSTIPRIAIRPIYGNAQRFASQLGRLTNEAMIVTCEGKRRCVVPRFSAFDREFSLTARSQSACDLDRYLQAVLEVEGSRSHALQNDGTTIAVATIATGMLEPPLLVWRVTVSRYVCPATTETPNQ